MPDQPPELQGMLRVYPPLSRLAGAAVGRHLSSRVKRGKEDADRLGERRGFTNKERPPGRLIWFHGASVGESLSVLALIGKLLDHDKDAHVMVTTGTVTSARLMEERLPERAFHQYVPLDHPDYVKRFLDHWRPDAGLWIESEFWPNLIHGAGARGMPLLLLNARISDKSLTFWRRYPKSIGSLLGHYAQCLAQDDDGAERLRQLGATRVKVTGNLKLSAPPLPVENDDLTIFRNLIGKRPVWLAASTHDEEDKILAAHEALLDQFPDLLTIIAPRQPDRGEEVARLASDAGFEVRMRSRDEVPHQQAGIYVADTIGEMGLFFRLAKVSFLGRSLIPKGGSNPLEAARLSSAVLTGPYTDNFRTIYSRLVAGGGARIVGDEQELADAVVGLLQDDDGRRDQCTKAQAEVAEADKVLDRVMNAVLEVLEPPGNGG